MDFLQLIEEIDNRVFKPVYILMGEEPYYNDIIVEHLMDKTLQPEERDFNQMIVYGSDTTAAEIVSLARRYPVFAPRQLIIVKEAQALTKSEPLEMYIQSPVPETVLALVYTGKSIDKRSGLYKKAKLAAEIFESKMLPEWKVAQWITDYTAKKGVTIVPDAASLMAEHTGNSLRKIVLEIDKLLKVIPEESRQISVKDIEDNIGISREFSAFERRNFPLFQQMFHRMEDDRGFAPECRNDLLDRNRFIADQLQDTFLDLRIGFGRFGPFAGRQTAVANPACRGILHPEIAFENHAAARFFVGGIGNHAGKAFFGLFNPETVGFGCDVQIGGRKPLAVEKEHRRSVGRNVADDPHLP